MFNQYQLLSKLQFLSFLLLSSLLPALAVDVSGNALPGGAGVPPALEQKELVMQPDGVGAVGKPPAQDFSLEELMNKIFLAYGGRQALAQMETNYVMTGQQKLFTQQTETISKFKQFRKGVKLRIEAQPLPINADQQAAPSAAVTVYDGTTAWEAVGTRVTGSSQETRKIVSEEAYRQPAFLTHFGQGDYVFNFLGRTQFKQMPVYAIEGVRRGVSPTTFFVDPGNYLVVAAMYTGGLNQNGVEPTIINQFSEYRPAGGTMVPFKQVLHINGEPTVELDVENISFNQPVNDSLFRTPGQVAASKLASTVSFPFDYTNQEMVVKVRVNGSEPLDFLFDTGASDIIIDRKVAADQFLDKQGAFNIVAASGAVSTQTSVINKLEVGNLSLENMPALILDLTPQSKQLARPIAGILGTSFMNQYAVTIDFSKQLILLDDPMKFKPPPGVTPVSYTQRQGPVIRALLNNKDEQFFLIDTGAAFNHLPEAQARRYIIGQPQHVTQGTGLDGRPVSLATLVLDSVEVGNQKLRKQSFTYAVGQPAPEDRNGFFKATNLGILGNPFWQNFVLTLDFKSQRLYLQLSRVQKSRREVSQMLAAGDSALMIHRDFRSAEAEYQRALAAARNAGDPKDQARIYGRIGNLRRIMAKDIKRPEQAKLANEYFMQAQAAARKIKDTESEGRILADWSLLYSDQGQFAEAKSAIEAALTLTPQDAQVNVDYAVHLYRAQAYQQMQQYIEKALFLEPSNWQALWYQVKLSEMFNDFTRLKSTLKEILRFYPFSKLARDKLNALSAPASPMVPSPAVGNTPAVNPPAHSATH